MTIDWSAIINHLTQLAIAFGLALPIAINRENHSRGAGLRTFPLVSIAACAYMLVGVSVFGGEDAQSRVLYGIITGMGFIGGGSILKSNNRVEGTATAAGIWNTGAIGISVAMHLYEIAITLSIVGFVIFFFATPLKKPVQKISNENNSNAADDS